MFVKTKGPCPAPDKLLITITPLLNPQLAFVGVPDNNGMGFTITVKVDVLVHPADTTVWVTVYVPGAEKLPV